MGAGQRAVRRPTAAAVPAAMMERREQRSSGDSGSRLTPDLERIADIRPPATGHSIRCPDGVDTHARRELPFVRPSTPPQLLPAAALTGPSAGRALEMGTGTGARAGRAGGGRARASLVGGDIEPEAVDCPPALAGAAHPPCDSASRRPWQTAARGALRP